MFQRAADDPAVLAAAETGCADQPEQQLGSALADKDLTLGHVEENPRIALGFVDDRLQRVGCRVVPPLIVGDDGHLGGLCNHGVQGKGATGVFEENARAVERATVHMGKAAANLFDQAWFDLHCLSTLLRQGHGIFHVAVASAASLPSSLQRRLSMKEMLRPRRVKRPSQVA